MSRFKEVATIFEKVQSEACDILENCDGGASFSQDKWSKDIGGGLTRVIQNGNKIEKGAINFSKVSGDFTPQMKKTIGSDGGKFSATGVSSIFHPKNPYSPIIHMNVRYFELDSGECWFGGGIDLTPHYIDTDEAKHFHKEVKKICSKNHKNFYGKFKAQADDYFYINHRKETRGIGGIFFDHEKPSRQQSFDLLLNFCVDIGELYPSIYSELLNKTYNISFGEAEIEWQSLRRSRYVEFNLVYDRGTKFGLESNGNTESILVSMPPTANWQYNHNPKNHSKEEKTMKLLKKGINWVNL